MSTTETKTVSKPYNIRKRAGRNIRREEQLVLDQVSRQVEKSGYSVMSSLFARVPGLLKFYCTAYRMDEHTKTSLPPFGVVSVNFLRNGDITVKVMGCRPDEGESVSTDTKWM